jgi:hypothetical protein
MSSNSITFRCYRCNRLLGAPRSKIGAVVACPKCAAELLVPGPPAPGGGPAPSTVVENPPARPEFPDFGPEAIRVEPAVQATVSGEQTPSFPGLRLETEPAAASAETPFFPTIRTEPVSLRSDASAARGAANQEPPTGPLVGPAVTPWPVEPPSDVPTIQVEPSSLRSASGVGQPRTRPAPVEPPAPVFPPIEAAPEPLRSDVPSLLADRPARRDDVVMPRTAVLLWSFIAFLALVLAFTTGLLAGHFMWKSG